MESEPSVKQPVLRIKAAAAYSSIFRAVSGFPIYEPMEACDGAWAGDPAGT